MLPVVCTLFSYSVHSSKWLFHYLLQTCNIFFSYPHFHLMTLVSTLRRKSKQSENFHCHHPMYLPASSSIYAVFLLDTLDYLFMSLSAFVLDPILSSAQWRYFNFSPSTSVFFFIGLFLSANRHAIISPIFKQKEKKKSRSTLHHLFSFSWRGGSFYSIIPQKSCQYLLLPVFSSHAVLNPLLVRPLHYDDHWNSSSGSPVTSCCQMLDTIDCVHLTWPVHNI